MARTALTPAAHRGTTRSTTPSTFLLRATEAASFWPEAANQAADLARMRALREEICAYTLCFRFSYLSRIGQHNEVNQALREALGLDWMLEELDRDSAQIDAHLSRTAAERAAALAHRQERRFRWASVLGVFGIAWLTTHTMFKGILHLEPVHQLLHLPDPWGPLASALLAVAVALIAALVTAFSGAKGHGHSLSDHAVHDQIIHTAGHH